MQNALIPPFSGRCLCRSIRYHCDAAPIWQSFCHCDSCRRATSSPVTAFFAIADGHWHWLGATPATFHSSPHVARPFCPTCGSPIAYRNDTAAPGEMHFYANTLDDPRLFHPTGHDFWDERMTWLHISDELQKE